MAKAKFDIKSEATRPLFASVGVADRAVEAVREFSRESVSRVSDIDVEPKALRQQAVTLVSTSVEDDTHGSVELAVLNDPRLDEEQKRSLLDLYGSYVGGADEPQTATG